jgi:FkbM family methyltransferase
LEIQRVVQLDSEVLFLLLVRFFRVDIVCDVGSHDAFNARRFRRVLPSARIIAFEANPELAQAMIVDRRRAADKIEVHHCAVHNQVGQIRFNVEKVLDGPLEAWRRRASSTRLRVSGSAGVSQTRVPTTRLDAFFDGDRYQGGTIALWIDVEGAAYEVLEGTARVRDRVCVVHVEVETEAFWQGQKLKRDVVRLMEDLGYVGIACDGIGRQHNMVFIDRSTLERHRFQIRIAVLLASGAAVVRPRLRKLLRRDKRDV